jgi:hypothetical protein
MTKFTLPTFYAASYVLPRKRTENNVLIRTHVDVDVRDVNANDAPVCFVIKDGARNDGQYRAFGISDGSPCVVRKFDGNFYAKRWAVDQVESDLEKSPDAKRDWDHATIIGGTYEDSEGYVQIGMGASNYERIVESRESAEAKSGPFRKWNEFQDRTISAVHDRCSELIVVDGWVYERVGEPVISIDVEHKTGQYSLRVVEERYPASRYHSLYTDRGRSGYPRFGLDELDRARTVANQLGTQEKKTFVEDLDLQIMSPWEVRFRGEAEIVLAVAASTASYGAEHIKDADGNFGLAWHDLVTALYVDGVVSPGLIDAMQRMASMGENGIFHRNSEGQIARFWAAKEESDVWKRIDFAVNLWSSRNNDGHDWVNGALNVASTHGQDQFAYEIVSLVQASKLAEKLGVAIETIDNLTTEAAAGRGHLIAVHDINGPVAAVFVVASEHGYEAVETVTRHGARSQKSAELAVSHANSAKTSVVALENDLALAGL